MRFRARVQRAQFGHFFTFVKTVSDVGPKTAVLLMDRTELKAVVNSDNECLKLWATLKMAHTFTDVILESRANNVIGVEVALPNLVHALKAGPSAEWVALKLTKKGPATYLTVEAAHVDGSVSVLQDVPIRVLSTADLARYGEPSLPHPTLRLSLPPAASMACVVERARAACATAKHITLAADSGAREVSLSAATEGVHIRTYYRGCGSGGDHRADASQAAAASVAVNIRDFGRVLRAVAGLNPPGQPAHQYEAILLLCAGQSLVVHAPLVVAAQPGDGGEPASGALGPTEAMLPVGFLTFILATMDPQGSDGTG